jgi:benzylsuccinate CoA-transferase BbsF subunit
MSDAQWAALVAVLGAPEWAASARWVTEAERHAQRRELDECLTRETRQWQAEELMHALQARGVPAGVVQNAEDVVTRDPQLAHRGHWVRLDHPEMGRTIYNAPPFRSRRVPDPVLERPAPLLGQHTDEVCRDLLGLSANEITALKRDGVIS